MIFPFQKRRLNSHSSGALVRICSVETWGSTPHRFNPGFSVWPRGRTQWIFRDDTKCGRRRLHSSDGLLFSLRCMRVCWLCEYVRSCTSTVELVSVLPGCKPPWDKLSAAPRHCDTAVIDAGYHCCSRTLRDSEGAKVEERGSEDSGKVLRRGMRERAAMLGKERKNRGKEERQSSQKDKQTVWVFICVCLMDSGTLSNFRTTSEFLTTSVTFQRLAKKMCTITSIFNHCCFCRTAFHSTSSWSCERLQTVCKISCQKEFRSDQSFRQLRRERRNNSAAHTYSPFTDDVSK